MRLLPTLLILVLGVGSDLSAASQRVDLPFDPLTLYDGRKLGAGMVKNYDPVSGLVVVQSERRIFTLPIDVLPPSLAQMVRTSAPVGQGAARTSSVQQMTVAVRQQPANPKDAQGDDARKRAEAERQTRLEEATRQQQQAAALARVRQLAQNKAAYYFTYEFQPGSKVVVNGAIQLSEPEAVSGWDNTYRCSGSIGLQIYDSRLRSFDQRTHRFEVTVEAPPTGAAKVVNFTTL